MQQLPPIHGKQLGGAVAGTSAGCARTSEAVRHSHIAPLVLTQQHADNALPCALCLATVMICSAEENEGCDRDGALHK